VLQTIDFEWHNPKEEETGGLWWQNSLK